MPKTLLNVKEDILSETRKMMLEKGYNKLCIREIAKNCHIATGTFYNYFSSKLALISSLLSSDWEKMSRSIANHLETDDLPLDKLEHIFEDLKRMIHNVHRIWALGLPDDMEFDAMNRMQSMKSELRAQYSSYVLKIIEGHVSEDSEVFMADFITRVFFSYAYDDDVDFTPLRAVLEKCIR